MVTYHLDEICSTDAVIVDAELARLRAIDNEREKANKQRLKGATILFIVFGLTCEPLFPQGFSTKLKRKRGWQQH
jgi:hypothetical protein